MIRTKMERESKSKSYRRWKVRALSKLAWSICRARVLPRFNRRACAGHLNHCHPEALLLREGSPGMLGSNLPLARLLGLEPSIESLIRFALASSASFIDCLGTR